MSGGARTGDAPASPAAGPVDGARARSDEPPQPGAWSGAILFSDVDRTLIHPARTAAGHGRAGADARVVEVYEGRGITTMSDRSRDGLVVLAAAGRLVPVTTRSRAQLRRVEALWALVAADGWAICANGAYVLHRGEPDADWDRALARALADAAAPEDAQRALDARFGAAHEGSWLLRWRDCEQRFLYAICDLDRTPADVQAEARTLLEPLGWTAYLHGRKLYALPAAITKEAAAAHVLDRLEQGRRPSAGTPRGTGRGDHRANDAGPRTVGAGDSAMDLGLVGWADAGWVPGDAEVVAQGLPLPPGARTGHATHTAGTEELLALLQAAVEPTG